MPFLRRSAYVPFGGDVVDQVEELPDDCRQATAWQRANSQRGTPFSLSVNISGKQLQHAQVVDDVRQAVAESGLPPSSLVLEMTESVLMDDENVLDILWQLKQLSHHL